MNKLFKKHEEPAEPPKPSKEQELLTEIRDLLKAQNGVSLEKQENDADKQ